MLRTAIGAGVDPIIAIRMCTLNAAECYGMQDRGAVAPGRVADLFIFDDLNSPTAREVYSGGRRVAAEGRMLEPLPQPVVPDELLHTCKVKWFGVRLDVSVRKRHIRVIGYMPNQIATEAKVVNGTIRAGNVMADPARDLLKIVTIERHKESGRCGVGFISGFGLKRGAIAGTIGRDHQNLIVIGCDNASMMTAAKACGATQGGLAAADGPNVLATLPLPIAGLMSDLNVEQVAEAYRKLLEIGRDQLGCPLVDPFVAMSFMSLEVLPALRLTDHGVVDVAAGKLVELWA
jgi:adenine deaminase